MMLEYFENLTFPQKCCSLFAYLILGNDESASYLSSQFQFLDFMRDSSKVGGDFVY